MTNEENKLRKVSFVNGIRSEDIDFDINLLDARMARERLRTAGFGIVEGFLLSLSSPFVVQVGEGCLISKSGNESFVPVTNLTIANPDAVSVEETCTVQETGEVVLQFRPYSSRKLGHLTNTWYQDNYPIDSEFVILDADNAATRIKAINVSKKTITLDASRWSGRKVTVKYYYTKNRIDSIMLNWNTYAYDVEKGILSSSPSHVDMLDYEDWLNIGLAKVIIEDDAYIELYEGYRSYRPVYVDMHNGLYLNGKPYKEQPFVHFKEPKPAYENALWYDYSTNTLYIWREKDGMYEWVVINDASICPICEWVMWEPEDCPVDLQTFEFPEDRIDLRYIPGKKALTILIDNAPLMADQYDEIVQDGAKEYLSCGIGFKLKDPLDRATHVECRVLHNVRSGPLRETFQRAAVFVNENYVYHNSLNTNRIYDTEVPYAVGESQLSVFLEGKKLEYGLEFKECDADGNDVSAGDTALNFKVLVSVNSGEKVSYRLERWVWSYDHLDKVVHDIEVAANDAKDACEELREDLDNLSDNVEQDKASITGRLTTVESACASLTGYWKKTDSIPLSGLGSTAKEKMVSGTFYETKPADALVSLDGVKTTDYMVVHYSVEADMSSRVLIRDLDYTIIDGTPIQIALDSSLVSSGAGLYITGIRFGA